MGSQVVIFPVWHTVRLFSTEVSTAPVRHQRHISLPSSQQHGTGCDLFGNHESPYQLQSSIDFFSFFSLLCKTACTVDTACHFFYFACHLQRKFKEVIMQKISMFRERNLPSMITERKGKWHHEVTVDLVKGINQNVWVNQGFPQYKKVAIMRTEKYPMQQMFPGI